jgi:hypothetical protein
VIRILTGRARRIGHDQRTDIDVDDRLPVDLLFVWFQCRSSGSFRGVMNRLRFNAA